MSKKIRLDQCVTDLGLFPSREQAKKAILAGLVRVNGQTRTKAGEQVPEDLEPGAIEIKGEVCPFVSRGGFKLAKGLDVFPFETKGKVFIDIGASTGGFTDCLLQHGAEKVYAVDVGYGQLDWRLRSDDRVISLERTNFRYLTAEDLPEKADATVMDVSFISILKLMKTIGELTKEESEGIWLIKPQFEAGPELVGKKGVIRDAEIHEKVLREVTTGIEACGFTVMGLDFSPVRGPKGNIEFLCHTKKGKHVSPISDMQAAIKTVVQTAHASFSIKDGDSNDTHE